MEKNKESEDKEQEDIVEGEIISEEAPASSNDQAQILLSLEEMIKANIASIDRLTDEKKKITESLADALNNDANYKQASDVVKETTKKRSAIRFQIM